MYKLLCFDLDDTLWPCEPTIKRAEQKFYAWLTEHKPQITDVYDIGQLREKRKILLQQRPELVNDLSLARRVHLRQLAAEFANVGEWVGEGIDEGADDWIEQAFDVFYQARQQVNLYDDVIPVLTELNKHYTLVALTNGNAHISKTGLADYFAFQLSAADVNAAKPHPAMFVSAMQRAGVSPQQTLHIGDHPVHDIKGARNAGLHAAWIRRFDQSWDQPEQVPELQFSDLYQLQRWLAQVE